MSSTVSPLTIRRVEAGQFEIAGVHVRLRAATRAPALAGEEPVTPAFGESSSRNATVGGLSGTAECAVSREQGLEFARELFRSGDGMWVGVRLSLKNLRQTAVRLTSLTPLQTRAAADICVADAAFADWRVLRMSRQKNDVPGTYRPAVVDDDFIFSAFASGGLPAGMGIPESGGEDPEQEQPLTVVSEPLIAIRNDARRALPGLFIGMLGQHEHLTGIGLTSSADRREFGDLTVICEFDDALVPPGAERTTHWLLLCEVADERAKLDEFAELLAVEFGVASVKKTRPTLYCSWYFYGTDFRHEDLTENLRVLAEKPVPIDAFLIDGGWMDCHGSWEPLQELFPDGLKPVADQIRAAGYAPGLWTAPFIVHDDAPIVKEHPELLAKDRQGAYRTYAHGGRTAYVVDPSSPYAEPYYNAMYGKIRDWGFRYHKLDFLRAIITTDDIRFHDPSLNRAQAYRLALTLVRRAMGADAYMLACGGLFEASIGIPDGMRSGSDVKGYWYTPRKKGVAPNIWNRMTHTTRIRQNVFRNYLNRFWHSDPDALMVRRREEPFRGNEPHQHLSAGRFTDEQAFTTTVNQYLAGGLVCISERFAELDDDRRALLRHVIPPFGPPARILDIERRDCPSRFLTEIRPRCSALGGWWTYTLCNWERGASGRTIEFADIGLPDSVDRLAVFEFRSQSFVGILTRTDIHALKLPPGATRVFRLAPWNGRDPVILGTDLHLSGGGCELEDVRISANEITGEVSTPWDWPVVVTAAFPHGDGARVASVSVPPEDRRFVIRP
ncbi:MAG: alpha-galactosidase [Kiritimatiellae bacterium]|nr:alpha-galactosidase [Kiritimatiellia bacterium]